VSQPTQRQQDTFAFWFGFVYFILAAGFGGFIAWVVMPHLIDRGCP
jgi:hypothetical protein